jgi:CheY-like chemotaxis protein
VNDGGTLRGKKILIIEDHDDTRAFLEWTFQNLGATTLTAGNTDEASQKVFTSRPDLIVCDIGLPGESGLGFVNWLRLQPSLRTTPCIAITAYSYVFPEQRATAFDAYLLKPLDIARLSTVAMELLGRRSSGGQTPDATGG